jgi:hypothetical protein
VGDQSEAVDDAKRRSLQIPADDMRGGLAGRECEAAAQGPARRGSWIATVEPAGAGAIAGDRAQKRGDAFAVAVMSDSLGPEFEPPSGLPKPPAEIEIAARANSPLKAPELDEGGSPHEQVRGARTALFRPDQPPRVIEEASRARVAGRERPLPRVAPDLAREGAAVVGNGSREVGVEQAGPGDAVCVDEQDPLVPCRRRARVSRVIGGPLTVGPKEAEASGHGCFGDAAAAIVGDDYLVAVPQVEASQVAKHRLGVLEAATEGNDHAHGCAACSLLRACDAGLVQPGRQSVGVTR